MKNELKSLEELCRILNVNSRWFRENWVATGKVPYYRLGDRTIRFSVPEVLEYFRETPRTRDHESITN